MSPTETLLDAVPNSLKQSLNSLLTLSTYLLSHAYRGAYYAEETLVYAIAYDNSTVIQPVTVSLIDSVDTNNFTCVLEPSKNTVASTTFAACFLY